MLLMVRGSSEVDITYRYRYLQLHSVEIFRLEALQALRDVSV